MIETLLFESIPTRDFLGLEKESPQTTLGNEILEFVKRRDCKFIEPNISLPNIPPVLELNLDLLKKQLYTLIFLERPIPLAISGKIIKVLHKPSLRRGLIY